MAMLRMVDRDVPCMGLVYEGIYQMLEQIKEVLKDEVDGASMYEEISLLAQERWEMLHSPLHATAFVPNFELFSKKPHKDKDVMKGWRMTLDRVGNFAIEKTEFKAELSQFIGLQGDFAEVSALEDMQKLSPDSRCMVEEPWNMHSQVAKIGHLGSCLKALLIRAGRSILGRICTSCTWKSQIFVYKKGNTQVLKEMIRQQFKRNMHETDKKRIEELKKAAVNGLLNHLILETRGAEKQAKQSS
ncbi:hypothetical protein L7F22_031119 [Adiantum nelumboides]|nr:hypothetical protein [Adiantum nelumboides]